MGTPDTFWLTLTNIALGVLVVACLLTVALAALYCGLSKLTKRWSYEAELDRDMEEMFPDGHRRAAAIRVVTSRSVRALLDQLRWTLHRHSQGRSDSGRRRH